ncbi:Transmembrane protein 100 [Merluccius polli]|uniref:Transmembrane protein 100 n=1 Tax=Merluccius polli TaxID=89951 RepID=A0AA47N0F7_MERPO|nr:Transmembrane protein 100 [Merluccius polli]
MVDLLPGFSFITSPTSHISHLTSHLLQADAGYTEPSGTTATATAEASSRAPEEEEEEEEEMGCSSGRQHPAPVLHSPDLDRVGSPGLPQDSDNQNRGSNGSDGGDDDEGGGGGGGGGEEGSRGEGEDGSLKPPPHEAAAAALPTLERLAQATGGTEKSWYRCVFPFGVISLVIGAAGTGVTFTFDTLLQTKVVSVALLCVGVAMLLTAAACWRAHRLRRRKKKEGGFFCSEQGTL